MNVINKYKFIIIAGLSYTGMYVNYYFTILVLVILFQIFISINSYKRLKSIFKFKKDICVQGIVLELRETTGKMKKYFKYVYIVEFEWENKKNQTSYQFTTLFKPKSENKIVDVWINESNPENSTVTESAGFKNRWLILLDFIVIVIALSVVDYFLLIKLIYPPTGVG